MKYMKQIIIGLLGAGLLLLAATSCRKESDLLMNFDHDDYLVFGAAEKSFVGKFEVLWNGLNQNYAIWDYEAAQGIDWDAVYDEYRPQFEALDELETVSDEDLTALLKKFLGPLHDGHLSFAVKNHKTGHSVSLSPGLERFKQRPDAAEATVPSSLLYYINPAHGEVVTNAEGLPVAAEYSTTPLGILTRFMTTPGFGLNWINAKIQELAAMENPTDLQAYVLVQLVKLRESFSELVKKSNAEAIAMWNDLQKEYAFLSVPGLDPIDPNFVDEGIDVKFALLKGNIAYFRMSTFALSRYLEEKNSREHFDMSVPATQQHVQQVKQVWQSWFEITQLLHKNGSLGGVIIDLRGNGGGLVRDSKYVVGSLVPAGGILFSYQRFKRGTGRYEYSAMMPGRLETMEDAHETITEPIVLLINCGSVSMSESSALCVKTLPNGTVIGQRSWGALCPIIGNNEQSYNYSGNIGVSGVTPVFGRVPAMAAFTLDGELIEATGITPDIEVALDVNQYVATCQDTQLDRALQFIRAGGVK